MFSRLLPLAILLFLLLNLTLLLSFWAKNEAQKALDQQRQRLTQLTQTISDLDRQLTDLYRTTADPFLTSLTFLNNDSFQRRAGLLAEINRTEDLEKKALTTLGRGFALLSLLTNSTNFLKPLRPAVESYLDEAQKTLVLYQWLLTSEKSLKPLLDFLTTLYLSLGRATPDGGQGFYPPFVREDLASYRQVLKGLRAQPYPENLPFASASFVEARQKIISELGTTLDQMAPWLTTHTPANVDQLKIRLVALDASLTNDSSVAKDNEKEFWAANLQLQKSAYLLEQIKLLNP